MKFLLALAFVVAVGYADEPACLPADNGEQICTAEGLKDGAELTKMAAALLKISNELGIEFNPKGFREPIPESKGVFSKNFALDEGGEEVFKGMPGAESIARRMNIFYGGAQDGIYSANIETGEVKKILDCTKTPDCIRPLGIRFAKDGTLYFIDGEKGLSRFDIEAGKLELLLPINTIIEGEPLLFPDDLDIDKDSGIIYFSDGSTKWPLLAYLLSVIEHDGTGRIIRYNIATGEASVFAKGMHFPNGVQLSHDKKHLLVDEFGARRILKFPLDAKLPVPAEVFVPSLPGFPDNIRPSLRGGYWVSLALTTFNDTPTVVDYFHRNPELAKNMGRWLIAGGKIFQALHDLSGEKCFAETAQQLRTGFFLGNTFPKIGATVELDGDGKVIRTLYSKQHHFLTETHETEEGIYFASFLNHYLYKVPKTSL